MVTKKPERTLRGKLEIICKQYPAEMFTAAHIYQAIQDEPKKSGGGPRRYKMSYPEVKQNMARAQYLTKVLEDERPTGSSKESWYRVRK